ncbi:hypothetical protein LE190_20045 [Massilia oculi]|uniref:Exo-alpha-sialidase n=1 Tax=Massilia hydrophila TaxID=3044279 RepID=A0ABS7YES4_9BURK|nr:hypothetical protein [Massilia oculi]MCA1858205.1 hypothetical protein [Massilia oculi]
MLMLHSSGIFRRSPHDSAWRQVLHVQETRGLRVHGKVVYLQGYAGLHVSTDGGITWALRKQHWIDAIGADGVLHGCAGQGPETSTDEGRSWQAVREPHPVPRDHPLWCEGREREARHEEQEYVLGQEGKLYYRPNPRAPWVRRAVEAFFPAHAVLSGLQVDRQGVVYVNIFIAHPDPNKHADRMIYLSRDQGLHWEALTWHASPVRPVDPEIWGVWNENLLMTCQKPGAYGTHLCIAGDSQPNALLIKEKTPSSTIGNHLTVAPDGSIYNIDMYGIERLAPGDVDWRPLGLEGVPGPFGGPREQAPSDGR